VFVIVSKVSCCQKLLVAAFAGQQGYQGSGVDGCECREKGEGEQGVFFHESAQQRQSPGTQLRPSPQRRMRKAASWSSHLPFPYLSELVDSPKDLRSSLGLFTNINNAYIRKDVKNEFLPLNGSSFSLSAIFLIFNYELLRKKKNKKICVVN
jgi:hypothetical protein